MKRIFDMIQIISKSLRILIFGILPLVLVGTDSKTLVPCPALEIGTYQFQLKGVVNENINGMASFNANMLKDVSGNYVKRLELSFKNEGCANKRLIQFELAQKPNSNGVYKIKNLERLFHSIDGVYGFVDLGEQHELPFFIETGSITIAENDINAIAGSLEVNFKNSKDETLHLKGFFRAK